MLTLPYDFRLLSSETAGVTAHSSLQSSIYLVDISVTNEGMWAGLYCVGLRSALDRSIITPWVGELIWINALEQHSLSHCMIPKRRRV
jgi:hypothetical protein